MSDSGCPDRRTRAGAGAGERGGDGARVRSRQVGRLPSVILGFASCVPTRGRPDLFTAPRRRRLRPAGQGGRSAARRHRTPSSPTRPAPATAGCDPGAERCRREDNVPCRIPSGAAVRAVNASWTCCGPSDAPRRARLRATAYSRLPLPPVGRTRTARHGTGQLHGLSRHRHSAMRAAGRGGGGTGAVLRVTRTPTSPVRRWNGSALGFGPCQWVGGVVQPSARQRHQRRVYCQRAAGRAPCPRVVVAVGAKTRAVGTVFGHRGAGAGTRALGTFRCRLGGRCQN